MDFGADSVFCINLSQRTDKREQMEQLANRLGIHIKFIAAIEDKINPHRGCFLSHASIISQAYKDGINRLLVFEDDVIESNSLTPEKVSEVNKFIDTNPTWEIVQLGATPSILLGSVRRISKGSSIFHGKVFTSGAYIMSKRGIERYKNLTPTEKSYIIDKHVFQSNSEQYAILPPLFIQTAAQNDISKSSKTILQVRNGFLRLSHVYGQFIPIPLFWMLVILFLMAIAVIIYFKCNR